MIKRRAGVLMGLLGVLLLFTAAVAQACPPGKAEIRVKKLTVPSSDTTTEFVFTGAVATTLRNNQQSSLIAVNPGTYTVTEAGKDGWVLGGITCSGDPTGNSTGDVATRTATFNVAAGEVVTCTFTNVARLRLTSICTPADHFPQERYWRISNPTGTDIAFALDVVGSPNDLSGTAPAGDSFWYTPAVGGPNTTLLMVNGIQHDVKASSNNSGCYEIRVEKVADPAENDVFSFTGGLGSFDLQDPDASSRTFGGLGPGSYSIAEVVPQGWSLDEAVCDARDWEATENGVTVHFGRARTPVESVTCTFYNTEQGRIMVEKVVPGGSPQSFSFDGSWADFSLTDGAVPHDSGYLEPGDYSVSEVLPLLADWYNTSAQCSTGPDGRVMPPDAIELRGGETVACVFVNEYVPRPNPGRIIVKKATSPVGAPAIPFSFDPSWSADNFVLSNGGSHDSGLLTPGIYTVAEVLPLTADWSAGPVACDDGSAVSAIGLSPGETVTCTFDNTYQQVQGPKASLTIIKDAAPLVEPDDTLFRFRGTLGSFRLADGGSRTFAELDPGAYAVAEVLPAGWQFDRVECLAGDWEAEGRSVTVNLSEGEAAVCTFYNQEERVAGPAGALTIVKQTIPAGGVGFSFTPSENLGDPFTLDDQGSVTFNELAAGAYTVAEDDPGSDWALQQVECTAGAYVVEGASVTVNLAGGEAAVCTFTNAAGELPYTGAQARMMPVIVAGLWALLLGLALVAWPARREST